MTQPTALNVAMQMIADCKDPFRRHLMYATLNAPTPAAMIRCLHQLMDTPAPNQPCKLSVGERHQRLHYIMSEFIEVVEASGFIVGVDPLERRVWEESADTRVMKLNKSSLKISHVEGQQQDTIEMLDGLADIVVVCFGMATEMGYDLMPILLEVVAASVTKLDPESERIKKNECQIPECQQLLSETEEGPCDKATHRPIPDEPRGKWIKGPNYTPPQIGAIIDLPAE